MVINVLIKVFSKNSSWFEYFRKKNFFLLTSPFLVDSILEHLSDKSAVHASCISGIKSILLALVCITRLTSIAQTSLIYKNKMNKKKINSKLL